MARVSEHKPYNRFKGFLKENGITYKEIAEHLGITEAGVACKINGRSDFYIGEVESLMKVFNFTYDNFF